MVLLVLLRKKWTIRAFLAKKRRFIVAAARLLLAAAWQQPALAQQLVNRSWTSGLMTTTVRSEWKRSEEVIIRYFIIVL